MANFSLGSAQTPTSTCMRINMKQLEVDAIPPANIITLRLIWVQVNLIFKGAMRFIQGQALSVTLSIIINLRSSKRQTGR